MQISIFYILIFLCLLSPLNSVKLSTNAKWNKTGIVVAGIGGEGDKSDQLKEPEAIFIHQRTNTLYVADTGNERIQMFSLDKSSTLGTTVISNVVAPMKLHVDDDEDGPTIYVALEGGESVKKWVQGSSEGVQVGGSCFYCTGVWVDKEKNVYLSSAGYHCVFKWSPTTNITTVVAGRQYYSGSTSDNLNSPEGIYVSGSDGAIYVADYVNNRIQRWAKDASNGTTVAGSSMGNEGNDAESLSAPTAVLVDDETGVVYVADSGNERIQRWLYNASLGDTIAGGFGVGDKSNQFDQPTDLAFDNKGNLYVCDRLNSRVVMFTLIGNEPIIPTSTANSSLHTTTITTIIFLIVRWAMTF